MQHVIGREEAAASHATGEQRQRDRQQGNDNDGMLWRVASLGAYHTDVARRLRRVCAEEGFAVGWRNYAAIQTDLR